MLLIIRTKNNDANIHCLRFCGWCLAVAAAINFAGNGLVACFSLFAHRHYMSVSFVAMAYQTHADCFYSSLVWFFLRSWLCHVEIK
jgi:hypothetical protein